MDSPASEAPSSTGTVTAPGATPPQSQSEEADGLARGTSVGRYVVLGELGAGGMGVVYAAYDPELDRKIALKLMRASTAGSTSPRQGQERLLREAQAMARLSHPNVIAVHDVGTFGDRVFIAMEFVEGVTVKQWLKERPRKWKETLSVFSAAGRGLAAAHAAGIVHRDFKPSNVLIGKDARVRVLDFGVARAVRSHVQSSEQAPEALPTLNSPALDTPLTRAGAVVGTIEYMAPEQLEGKPTDARTDQFGFCVALYEAFYAKRPFAVELDPKGTPQMMLARQPERPQGTAVPRWVHRVLLRGLRDKPEERYPSLDALLEQLGRDPAATRRRWLGGLAAALLVAAGVVGYRQTAKQQSLLCKGAERKLSGVWDRERKVAIEKAFAATSKPYAKDTWARVQGVLDGYTRDWVAAHTEACEATRVRGEQSEDLLSLRMACLSQRLDEVQALTSLFARADEQVVDKAVPAAYALTSLKGCSDAQALLAPVRPPDDAAVRAQVASARTRLAGAKALFDAGKFSDGLEAAAPVVSTAKTLKYRPLEAEALQLLGNLQVEAGDPKAGEKTLKEALLAAEAGRHDRVLVRILSKLIHTVGALEARYEEGHELSLRAQAALERLGKDEEEKAYLWKNIGSLLHAHGKFAEALPYYRGALETSARLLGPDDVAVGKCHNDLAAALMGRGEHAEALAHLQQALAIFEKTVGPEHPLTSMVQANTGGLLNYLGRYREALVYERKALDARLKTLGPDHYLTAITLQNIALSLSAQGRCDEAESDFERAFQIFTKKFGPSHPYVAATLDGLGMCSLKKGRADEALQRHRRALAMYEKTMGPQYPDAAASLTGIGEALLAQGAPDQAIAPMERALKISAADSTDPMQLAETRFALARALWQSGRDPQRAKALAALAEQGYATGPESQKRQAEVAAWRAQHP